MKVNDRVTVKTDGGPRRPGVVLAVEEFSEGTMYLVSLEDYPLGIWFFNEAGHHVDKNTISHIIRQSDDMVDNLFIMRFDLTFNITFMR